MDAEGFSVVLELERLRGAVNEGFATVNGRFDGVVQRTADVEKDVEKLEAATDERFKAMEARVSALEKKVWAAAGVAAVISGGGAASLLHVLSQ
jgi:hypothetical protein